MIHGARVTRRDGFEVATLPRIIAIDTRDNRASIAAMERIGLTRRGEFDHPRLPPDHCSYRHVPCAKEKP